MPERRTKERCCTTVKSLVVRVLQLLVLLLLLLEHRHHHHHHRNFPFEVSWKASLPDSNTEGKGCTHNSDLVMLEPMWTHSPIMN
jgi:hypothetical protein